MYLYYHFSFHSAPSRQPSSATGNLHTFTGVITQRVAIAAVHLQGLHTCYTNHQDFYSNIFIVLKLELKHTVPELSCVCNSIMYAC
jgi:hypothetical protein